MSSVNAGPAPLATSWEDRAGWLAATLLAGSLALLFLSGAHALGVGNDDRILIQAFSSDANRAVLQLQANLREGDLDPRGFFNYGYLYHAVCYVPLRVLATLGIDAGAPRTISFVTRGVSLLCWIGLIAVFLRALGPVHPSPAFRLAFTALLASGTLLWRWSYRTHPDLLLTLLGASVLLVLLPGVTRRRVWVASALVGLAFGTKASGSYYAVLVAAAFVADRASVRSGDWRADVRGALPVALPAVGAFLVGWLGSNPYALLDFGDFLEDFLREQAHVARGHGRAQDTSVLDWAGKVVRCFSWSGVALLAVGWAAALGLARAAYRDPARRGALPPLPVVVGTAVFAVVAFGHLALVVDLAAGRYLLPILPALVWLSAFGWALLCARAPRIRPAAIALLIAVPVAANAWTGARDTRHLAAVYTHPRVVAGHWLADHYPRETRILLERYGYAPPDRFDHIRVVPRITQRWIDRHPVDVLVLNRKKSGRWSWPRPGTRFADRDFTRSDLDEAERTHALLHALAAPDSGWRPVYESDDVIVLERLPRDTGR